MTNVSSPTPPPSTRPLFHSSVSFHLFSFFSFLTSGKCIRYRRVLRVSVAELASEGKSVRARCDFIVRGNPNFRTNRRAARSRLEGGTQAREKKWRGGGNDSHRKKRLEAHVRRRFYRRREREKRDFWIYMRTICFLFRLMR